MFKPIRGMLAVAALAAGIAAMAPSAMASQWNPPESLPGDVVIGSKDAPVTVFEYASLTCPHCARFHSTILPAFKKDWVDTGKAKVVYRHFPLDKSALAGALAVTCLPAEQRPAAVAKLLETASTWAKEEDIGTAVTQAIPGVSDPLSLIPCMSSQDTTKSVIEPAFEASRNGVRGTPYFIVGGRGLQGTASASKLGELVDEAIKGEFTR